MAVRTIKSMSFHSGRVRSMAESRENVVGKLRSAPVFSAEARSVIR